MTCVQPASRYSSIASMQSAGVPAIGLHLSRIASVTFSLAASRPPASIASAIGRISSWSRPARSSSVSADAPDVLDLVREVHARDLTRTVSTFVAVLGDRGHDRATEVECRRRAPPTTPRRARSRACSARRRSRDRGSEQAVADLPERACIFGTVAATYTGGTSRGVSASLAKRGNVALTRSVVVELIAAEHTAHDATRRHASRPRGFAVCVFALLRKIFDVPKPSRNRPGPAASCTTRASIAACTG